jgi:phenylpropionate dioxygenase-like ring-hydroxylating dioxygenase large terminal subunit
MSYFINMADIPTKVYFDPAILEEERTRVFDRSWIFAGLSSQLPHPNTEWLFELAGHSILLTRDKFGQVHACRNSCLHRGAKFRRPNSTLSSRFTGWKGSKSTSIVCPYHGWNYDMSGRLCHITQSQDFLGDVEDSLYTYQTYENSGLIWIALKKPRYSAEYFLKNINQRLEKYKLEEMVPIEASDFSFPINWKLCLENSLDYYHVSQVHQKSVSAHVSTSPTFQDLHWHNLQTLHIAPYKWRKHFDNLCTPNYGFSDFEISSLHKYLVFPNLIVNVLPYHLTIMQYWPIDERNCILRYRFCRRKGRNPIEKSRAYISWLASRWILYEDVRLYRSIQEGIENSTQAFHSLHNQEISIAHFHQRIMEWMQEKDFVQSIK